MSTELQTKPVTEELTRNWWPSYCAVCETGAVWFPTLKGRRLWEEQHQHGGVD